MSRFFQALLIAAVAGCAWPVSLALHESGHVLFGRCSGATAATVHLPPLGVSRTDFAANPHPLFVAWGGFFGGCVFPLLIFGAACIFSKTARGYATRYSKNTDHPLFLLAWFVGLCLILNGGYALGGALMPPGGGDDGGVILQHGGSRWQLAAFGLPMIALGLYFWNGLGPAFGFGPSRGRVNRRIAITLAVAAAAMTALQMIVR
jgi:hypothetical protein